MHDNVLGIDIPALQAQVAMSNLRYVLQPMLQQDNFQVIGDVGGDVAAFDNAFFTFWYEDLIGATR